MGGRIIGVLYAVVMVAVIVGVDFALFRGRFWERLMVNIGIVLVFAAFYLRFLMRPSSPRSEWRACIQSSTNAIGDFTTSPAPPRSAALDPTQHVHSRKGLQIQLISVMTRKG
jgi:hypothetical protein